MYRDISAGSLQRTADLIHAKIDTVVDVDVFALAPEATSNFLPGHELAAALDQQGEHSKGLCGQLAKCAVLTQFARRQIQLERAESNRYGWLCGRIHAQFHGSGCAKTVHRRAEIIPTSFPVDLRLVNQ